MTQRSVTHSTFTIERHYEASPQRVFRAFADPKAKRRWFAEGEGWKVERYELDFKIGGYEGGTFRFGDGPPIRNDTWYQDIVPDQRIICAYAMTIGENRISVSLATTEFKPADTGTLLVYTEQGAFLDGHDNVAQREAGMKELLTMLEKEVGRDS
jgi:uncharacterized protein YndB with AHSA1/START domain